METATDKQIAYLVALWEGIAHPADEIDAVRNGTRVLDKREASRLIDDARSRKTDTARTTAPAITVGPGFYIQQDTIYKVVLSARDRLYAKRLVPGGTRGRWEFAPGKVASLSPADTLTPERAAEWGRTKRKGHDGSIDVYCAVCGAELENQESRDRGIGPVCYRKYF